MTRAEMLLYLKKERSTHGVRVVDAFHNVRRRYTRCPFEVSDQFLKLAHPEQHSHGKFIERVYFEYLSLKVISE